MKVLAPVPLRHTVSDQVNKTGLVTRPWQQFLMEMRDILNATPGKEGAVALTAQGASIVATAVPTSTLAAGLYRINYVARISTAAGTSSSLTVTLGWTVGGVACAFVGDAMVGNTTAEVQVNSFLVRIDAGTTITYATAYVSVGAPSMTYTLDVTLELLP